MSTPPPTLEHYKLETEFHDGYVVNRTYEWDYSVRREKGLLKWKRGKSLGRGAFGVVYLEEEETTGELRAVKCLERTSAVLMEAGVTRELLALIILTPYKHLFVELFGWYENESNTFIAMEYMKGGDLSGYIKDPEQSRTGAKVITKQILEGLKVIHENGICHRDLKPQNILIARLDPIWVKLADFGTSKQTKNTALRTRCGTQGYLAPELQGLLPRQLRVGSREEFSFALDMWSLGCLLHEMLTSRTPFLQITEQFTDLTELDFMPETNLEALFDYCRGDIALPVENLQSARVSVDGICLISQLLLANPTMRPTAIRTLQHSWLADAGREHRTGAENGPDPACAVIAPTRLSVTEDQCFNSLMRFIDREKTGLRVFYNDQTLRELAPAAKTMIEGLFGLGCKKEVAMQLSILVLYDIALLIDDSNSMSYAEGGYLTATLQQSISEISAIYELANPTGIRSMRFLNNARDYTNVTNEKCQSVLEHHVYVGDTKTGTMLEKRILDKYVWGLPMVKPLLVIVITYGGVEGERERILPDVIERCIARLRQDPTRGIHAVSFQFSIIGNDHGAREMYRRLRNHTEISDHLDIFGLESRLELLFEPEKIYRWIVIPKLLLGAIMKLWCDIGDNLETVF